MRKQPKTAVTRKRRQMNEFQDVVEFELLHARAVLMTAVLALEGKGVHSHVAIALRGCDRGLTKVQEALADLRGSPIVTHLT